VALRFARVKATHDLGTSIVSQLLAERILRSPAWPARAAARNDDLRGRYRLLASLLTEHLPSWRWIEPSGGLSLWVQLPLPVARPFAELSLRYGVTVATADALSPTGGHGDRLRLSFAPPAASLRLGVERLAAAWSAWVR
jgi:DNA-binding transcriptional MocR family regulator